MPDTILRLGNRDANMSKKAHRVVHKVFHGHKHIVTLAKMRVREREMGAAVRFSLDPQKVTVYCARSMAGLLRITDAIELVLNSKELIKQNEGMQLRANLGNCIGDRRCNAVCRLSLIC
jgi:hypothetical protein